MNPRHDPDDDLIIDSPRSWEPQRSEGSIARVPDPFKTIPCKGCGKPIVWGEYENDKGVTVRVPLDPRPPVYRIKKHDASGTAQIVRERMSMPSHFATCVNASQFSGERRK